MFLRNLAWYNYGQTRQMISHQIKGDEKTCLGRDGYNQSTSGEQHNIGMDDGELEVLDLGEHLDDHPLTLLTVNPHHHVLLGEADLDLR